MRGLVLTICLALGLVVSAPTRAEIPDPANSQATLANAGHTLFVCPEGDGETLAEVGATITVTVLDANGDPCAGFDSTWISLRPVDPAALVPCLNGVAVAYADGPTDASGTATFTGALAGGGTSDAGFQIWVYNSVLVVDQPLQGPILDLRTRSPDVAPPGPDGRVDLADLAEFSTLFEANVLIPSVDLNHDNVLDLCDWFFFTSHYTHLCL